MPRKNSNVLPVPKSYISLAYGALTVIVLFAIVFFAVRTISQRSGTITEEAGQTVQGVTYEVKEGDNLWSIAETQYSDGYKWTEIAKVNNLKNPDVIEKGMSLTLPELVQAKEEAMQGAQGGESKITGDSYKVVERDSLWIIAVRAYGDGYKWVEIAKANNLANPDLIHPGNVFKLLR